VARCLLQNRITNKDITDLSGLAPIHLCIIESSRLLLNILIDLGDDVN
jgi:hypothetical protein